MGNPPTRRQAPVADDGSGNDGSGSPSDGITYRRLTFDVPEELADDVVNDMREGESIIQVEEVDEASWPLVRKITAAMQETTRVTKDGRNTHDNYDYASIEVMLEEVRGPLHRRGVLLLAHPAGEGGAGGYVEQEARSSTNKVGVRVLATFDFQFTDGEAEVWIRGWRGEGIDYGDKAIAKANTNAIKTFVRAQWLLPAGDDPEQDSPERVAAPREDHLPAWAREASMERKNAAKESLTTVIGEEAAMAILTGMKATYGVVPDLVPALVRHIAVYHNAERQVADDSHRAAEEPEEPPVVEEPEEEPPPVVGERAMPEYPQASLDRDDERAPAACICVGGFEAAEADPEKRNDECPVKTHGIPF